MGLIPPKIKVALNRLDYSLKLDITQLVLDVFGIFDATPTSDGLNAFISLCRGDFLGAAVGVVSILPLGDAAKFLKLKRYVSALQKLVKAAKNDVVLRVAIQDLVKTLKNLVDKLPMHSTVDQLRRQIDILHGLPLPPTRFPLESIKHMGPIFLRERLAASGFHLAKRVDRYKVAATNLTKHGPSGVPVGSKEFWYKRDPASKGYFVVRMDLQGHATKIDYRGKISVTSQRRSGEHLTHGGRPHYHKEWVPEAEFQDYLKRPVSGTAKFDDAGELSGLVKDTHIPR